MLRRRTIPIILATLAILGSAAPLAARTSGVVGYSGIEGISCNTAGCHTPDEGTAEPLVRFEGPQTLEPGEVGRFRFVVASQSPEIQIQAGFNVAAAAGTLLTIEGERTRLQPEPFSDREELTHTGPKDNDANGEAAWSFQWQAPPTAGEYALWGAGNSVDAFGTNAGDASAIAMLLVRVGEIAPAPTHTPTHMPSTPTPTHTPPALCAGDCNGDGVVAVNELIAGVTIALGSAAVDVCTPCDGNGDGSVSINELVNAVSRLLNGC